MKPKTIVQRFVESTAEYVEPGGNPLSDAADALLGAAERISGLVPRTRNLNLSGKGGKLVARLQALHAEASDVAEIVDNPRSR